MIHEDFSVFTLKMKDKITEDKIRNGAIRWQISIREKDISSSLYPSGFLMYVSVCLFIRLLVRVVCVSLSAKCFAEPQTGWRRPSQPPYI